MPAWKGLDEGGHEIIRYFGPAEEAHARALGFEPANAAEAAQATGTIDDRTGGVLGAVGAGATAALSGATLGLSDAALRGVLSDAEMGRVAADRADHPYLSGAAQFAGALAPAFISGGAALPSSLAARTGAGVDEAVGGGLAGRALGGVAEGALYGAGQGVSDVSLSSDPVTVERAASAISSNMLLGGALGGALGVAGGAAELGLRRAKGLVDDAMEARLAKAKTPDEAIESGDLEHLTTQQLKAARQTELEALTKAQEPQRQGFVDDLGATRKEAIEREVWNATKGLPDRESRTIGQAYLEADKKIDALLKDRVSLVENPERALGPLRRQQQALEALEAMRAQQSDAFAQEVAAAPQTIRAEIAARDPKSLAYKNGEVGPFTDDGLTWATEREIRRRYGDLANPTRPKRLQALDKVPEELSANRDLQRVLAGLTEAPASPRLSKIDAALDALQAPKEKSGSLGGQLLHTAASFAGPLGAMAEAGTRAVGGLRKAAGAIALKTGKAVSSFLDTAATVTAKAAPAAVPAATAVLAGAKFGRGSVPKSDSLADLYAARTAELRQHTMMAPDGSIQMRPQARMAITRQLAPIAAVDPLLADRIETVKARTIAYMSSKIPKRPEVGGIQVGPDNWRPSELAMRSWARTVRACEDPTGVEMRLAAGIITPEEAEAYRTCYPERLAALRSQIFAAVPTLSKTLSTSKKVALYTMTGVPTMPALQPNILAVLQASFAVEPGTAGGQQAPKPMPSFGALGSPKTMDQPTPAQKRGG